MARKGKAPESDADAAAAAILLDSTEDENIRHCALSVVQCQGPTKEARDVLACVVPDVEMGEHAQRLLQKYEERARSAT
jgi:hypothetical protein